MDKVETLSELGVDKILSFAGMDFDYDGEGSLDFSKSKLDTSVDPDHFRCVVNVGVRLDENAILPSYANYDDSGADLFCKEKRAIPPNVRVYN